VVYFVVKIGGGKINPRLCPRKASYCRMHMVFMLDYQHLAPTYHDWYGKNCLKETWQSNDSPKFIETSPDFNKTTGPLLMQRI